MARDKRIQTIGMLGIAFVLLGSAAAAQSPDVVTPLPILNHPQKTEYASPAEWPTTSAQCHWDEPMDMGSGPVRVTAHTHVDTTFPQGAVVNDPIVVPFAVKLFHASGRITRVDGYVNNVNGSGQPIRDLVWDATGTSTPPDLTGDPMGLKSWTGHFTMVPSPVLLSGVDSIYFFVDTQFASGAAVRTYHVATFYRTTNPSGGPSVVQFGGGTQCQVLQGIENVEPGAWGFVTSAVRSHLPLLPITSPWTVTAFGVGYNAKFTSSGEFMQREDLDLHNNVQGKTLDDLPVVKIQDGITRDFKLDPAQLADSTPPVGQKAGTHKLAWTFTQRGQVGNEVVTALYVRDIPVGAAGKPLAVAVPNVIGQSQQSAARAIAAAELVVGGVTISSSRAFAAGNVISQSPPAGAQVARGTRITIVISNGAPPPAPPAK